MKLFYCCVLLCLIGTGLLLYSNSVTRGVESRLPPVGDFVKVDGLKLHYLDSGEPANIDSPTTLVLLHGASTSLLDFQTNVLPALSASYRVIAFDRPGLGYSQRADQWPDPATQASIIGLALQSLDVDKAVWIGHSWAGSVVLAAMLDNPQQVRAGVLLAGATHPWDSGVSWHVALTNQPVIGTLFSHLIVPVVGSAALEGAVSSVFEPERVPDDYIKNTGVKLSLRPQVFINNAADIYHLSNWLTNQTSRYDTLSQPLLMITGTADDVVPSWNHAERLTQQVPTAQWYKLDGAGHALHHSRTVDVIDHIQQFLSAHAPSNSSAN